MGSERPQKCGCNSVLLLGNKSHRKQREMREGEAKRSKDNLHKLIATLVLVYLNSFLEFQRDYSFLIPSTSGCVYWLEPPPECDLKAFHVVQRLGAVTYHTDRVIFATQLQMSPQRQVSGVSAVSFYHCQFLGGLGGHHKKFMSWKDHGVDLKGSSRTESQG